MPAAENRDEQLNQRPADSGELLRKLTPEQAQELAKKLYAMLRDDLRIERERLARGASERT